MSPDGKMPYVLAQGRTVLGKPQQVQISSFLCVCAVAPILQPHTPGATVKSGAGAGPGQGCPVPCGSGETQAPTAAAHCSPTTKQPPLSFSWHTPSSAAVQGAAPSEGTQHFPLQDIRSVPQSHFFYLQNTQANPKHRQQYVYFGSQNTTSE